MSTIEQCSSCKGYTGNCSLENPNDPDLCKSYEPAIDNSGLFKRLFYWSGRIRRLEYCLTYLILLLLYVLMGVIDNPSLYGLYFGLSLLFILVMTMQCIKRSHDLGHSGWWILLPIYNPLALMFLRGDEGINEYGTDPKQRYESQVFNEKDYKENLRQDDNK